MNVSLVLFIVLALALYSVTVRLVCRYCEDVKIVMSSVAVGLLSLLLCIPFAVWMSCTNGLVPGYSSGCREGYVVKLSEKGLIWKTWEGSLQLGAGVQTAVGEPWEFSIGRDRMDLHATVSANIGKKVKITYREWLIMPFRIGDSQYEIQSVEVEDGQ